MHQPALSFSSFKTMIRQRFPAPLAEGFLRAVKITGVFALTIMLAMTAIELTRGEGRIAAIWPINAFFFVIVMKQRPEGRLELFAAFAAGLLTTNILCNDNLYSAALYTVANVAEVAIAIRIFAQQRTLKLITTAGIARLLSVAAIASTASTLIVIAGKFLLGSQAAAHDVMLWFMADALGYILVVPILWTLSTRPHPSEARLNRTYCALQLSALGLMTAGVFGQDSLPVLFLVGPMLVWLAFSGGVRRAARGALVVAIVSIPLTLQGSGPIALIDSSVATKVLVLQLFFAIISMTGLAVGAAMMQRQRLAAQISRSRSRLKRIAAEQSDMLGKALLAEQMSGVGHWTMNVLTSEVYWSPEVYAIHGVTPQEFDPQYDCAISFFAEEDRSRVNALIGAGLETGKGWEFDASLIRRSDGARRRVRALGKCVSDKHGKVVRAFGVFQDVTETTRVLEEHAAREKQYRLLADYSTDIIVQFDLQGRIVYASPSCRILGVTPEEAIGRTTIDFVIDEDKKHAQFVTAQHSVTGAVDPNIPREFRVRNAAGEIIWLEGNPKIIHGPDGKPQTVVSSFRDVSDRREREAALARARAEAEAALRAKADFLSNMSHEIRTPLNGVLGFAQLIQQTEMSPQQAHYIRRITDAGRMLRQIVDDILDYSKIEAGKMSMDLTPLELGGVIRNVIDLVDAGRADHSVRITCDIDRDTPIVLVSDETRIRQILTNIIGNACKFTKVGSVSVSLVHAADMLEVRVQDTGVGIPASQLETIFESFRQADSSVTRQFGGTGLGLSISRSLARLMGGDIKVESELGKGTLVRIRIPNSCGYAEPVVEDADDILREPVRNARIMAVDDVEMNLELVKIGMTNAGHEVVSFRSAAAAIEDLKTGSKYDIILMDVQMPDMDGPTATRIIRGLPGRNARLPIIALTAHAIASDVAAFKEAGMTAHFPKPIDLERLDAFVRELLLAQRGNAEGPPVGLPAPEPAAIPGPAKVEDVLVVLRREYKDYLATVFGEIEKIMEHPTDEAAASSIAALAHAIAGTAGSLGFPEVSEAAFALEAAAKELRRRGDSPDRLQPALDQFLETVKLVSKAA